jgi:hypothetical protein
MAEYHVLVNQALSVVFETLGHKIGVGIARSLGLVSRDLSSVVRGMRDGPRTQMLLHEQVRIRLGWDLNDVPTSDRVPLYDHWYATIECPPALREWLEPSIAELRMSMKPANPSLKTLVLRGIIMQAWVMLHLEQEESSVLNSAKRIDPATAGATASAWSPERGEWRIAVKDSRGQNFLLCFDHNYPRVGSTLANELRAVAKPGNMGGIDLVDCKYPAILRQALMWLAIAGEADLSLHNPKDYALCRHPNFSAYLQWLNESLIIYESYGPLTLVVRTGPDDLPTLEYVPSSEIPDFE